MDEARLTVGLLILGFIIYLGFVNWHAAVLMTLVITMIGNGNKK